MIFIVRNIIADKLQLINRFNEYPKVMNVKNISESTEININGITISPKKNFCIMKVWVANCLFQDATVIRDVEGVSSHGCLFKRHVPEY